MFVNIDCGFFGCMFGLFIILWVGCKILPAIEHRRVDRVWKMQCERKKKELYEEYNRIIEKETRRAATDNDGGPLAAN